MRTVYNRGHSDFPPQWFDLEKYAAAKNFDATDWLRQLKIRSLLRALLTEENETTINQVSLQLMDVANLCFKHGIIPQKILAQSKNLAIDLFNKYGEIPKENLFRKYAVILVPQEVFELLAIDHHTFYFILPKKGKEWSLVYKIDKETKKASATEIKNIDGLFPLLNQLLAATEQEINSLNTKLLQLIEPYVQDKCGWNAWLYAYEPTAQLKTLFGSVYPLKLGAVLSFKEHIKRGEEVTSQLEHIGYSY